ncbi:MAG: tetratricopeptide repeat protein [Pseudomonadota bacterium]|nr:tetratricopeptide repeat protein [Pseudomonadota bacterium]
MSHSTRALGDPYEEGLALGRAGRHAEAIGRFEAALARDPADIRVLFALGNTARALAMPAAAEDFFRRVLALAPGRLEALVNLANLLRANGNPEAAIALLSPALARAPEAAELWLALGSAHRETDNRPEAERHWQKALELKPEDPAALGNLADLMADSGEVDGALALYDRALKRDGRNAQARLNRAILHFLKGNLTDGWRDYAARLKIPGKVPQTDHRLPPWDGGPLKKTRLLVTAEQGVGDQIMFASLIPDLAARAAEAGGAVILECEARLAPLFARSFPSVKVVAGDLQAKGGIVASRYGWLKAIGGANRAVEMGTLPRFLRRELGDFPTPNAYLVPDAEELSRWRGWQAANGEGPAIGVCWRSGKRGGLRNLQYAPLEAWGHFLARIPGRLICAQYDAAADEIAELERLSGRPILLPPGLDQKNELDRTCAMLSALDAVISAPTAVSWLSAGAGVPTFKVLYDSSWTALGRAQEPFAPSCRPMRPDAPGHWASAFAKTLSALTARP